MQLYAQLAVWVYILAATSALLIHPKTLAKRDAYAAVPARPGAEFRPGDWPGSLEASTWSIPPPAPSSLNIPSLIKRSPGQAINDIVKNVFKKNPKLPGWTTHSHLRGLAEEVANESPIAASLELKEMSDGWQELSSADPICLPIFYDRYLQLSIRGFTESKAPSYAIALVGSEKQLLPPLKERLEEDGLEDYWETITRPAIKKDWEKLRKSPEDPLPLKYVQDLCSSKTLFRFCSWLRIKNPKSYKKAAKIYRVVGNSQKAEAVAFAAYYEFREHRSKKSISPEGAPLQIETEPKAMPQSNVKGSTNKEKAESPKKLVNKPSSLSGSAKEGQGLVQEDQQAQQIGSQFHQTSPKIVDEQTTSPKEKDIQSSPKKDDVKETGNKKLNIQKTNPGKIDNQKMSPKKEDTQEMSPVTADRQGTHSPKSQKSPGMAQDEKTRSLGNELLYDISKTPATQVPKLEATKSASQVRKSDTSDDTSSSPKYDSRIRAQNKQQAAPLQRINSSGTEPIRKILSGELSETEQTPEAKAVQEKASSPTPQQKQGEPQQVLSQPQQQISSRRAPLSAKVPHMNRKEQPQSMSRPETQELQQQWQQRREQQQKRLQQQQQQMEQQNNMVTLGHSRKSKGQPQRSRSRPFDQVSKPKNEVGAETSKTQPPQEQQIDGMEVGKKILSDLRTASLDRQLPSENLEKLQKKENSEPQSPRVQPIQQASGAGSDAVNLSPVFQQQFKEQSHISSLERSPQGGESGRSPQIPFQLILDLSYKKDTPKDEAELHKRAAEITGQIEKSHKLSIWHRQKLEAKVRQVLRDKDIIQLSSKNILATNEVQLHALSDIVAGQIEQRQRKKLSNNERQHLESQVRWANYIRSIQTQGLKAMGLLPKGDPREKSHKVAQEKGKADESALEQELERLVPDRSASSKAGVIENVKMGIPSKVRKVTDNMPRYADSAAHDEGLLNTLGGTKPSRPQDQNVTWKVGEDGKPRPKAISPKVGKPHYKTGEKTMTEERKTTDSQTQAVEQPQKTRKPLRSLSTGTMKNDYQQLTRVPSLRLSSGDPITFRQDRTRLNKSSSMKLPSSSGKVPASLMMIQVRFNPPDPWAKTSPPKPAFEVKDAMMKEARTLYEDFAKQSKGLSPFNEKAIEAKMRYIHAGMLKYLAKKMWTPIDDIALAINNVLQRKIKRLREGDAEPLLGIQNLLALWMWGPLYRNLDYLPKRTASVEKLASG